MSNWLSIRRGSIRGNAGASIAVAPAPSPSPTPTPSFSYPTADGVTALTPYPAAGTDYNGATGAGGTSGNGPATSTAQAATYLAAASAGQRVYMAAGTYGHLDLNSISKGSGNPVRLVPADTTNRPLFKGVYSSNTSALYIDSSSGIALEGLKFAMDDVPSSNVTRFLCQPSGTNSNIWLVGCELYGNYIGDGGNNLEMWKGANVTGLHALGNYIHDIGQGFSTLGDDNEIAFNRFARIQSDWCTSGDGIWNLAYYFNYTLEPESYDLNHSDGFQITSKFATRQWKNIRLYNNFAICPANLRPDPNTGSSLARMQFVIIGDDKDGGNPGCAPDVIVIHSMKGYGCITNTMLAGYGSNGVYKNNEAYHIRGTYAGGGDSDLHSNLDSTKIELGTGGGGVASGNVAYLFNNLSAGSITGQASTAADPTKIRTFAQAQTALFAWLASGDFAQARALMNMPADRFLPF